MKSTEIQIVHDYCNVVDIRKPAPYTQKESSKVELTMCQSDTLSSLILGSSFTLELVFPEW